MLRFLSRYKLLLSFIYLTLFTALGSTPMNEVFRFSGRANQIFALLLYMPFMAVICWKLFCDLKHFQKHIANLLYYVFGFYYIFLSAIRILYGMEVKENIYYSVVLFGAIALWLQLRDDRLKLANLELRANLTGILIYTVAVKILLTGLTGYVFSNEPLNNLYSTSVLVMLIPFMIEGLKEKTGRKAVLYPILLCLSAVLILICASRAVVMLSICVLAIVLVMHLRERRALVKTVISIFCAIAIVASLAAFDAGRVRYSLYREFGFVIGGQMDDDPSDDFDEDQIIAEDQTERSDSMRSDLLKLGVEEVKKNFLFGTGNLFYTYDLGYKTMEQTAHNFLVESMVCFGLIGTLMIAAIVIFMVSSCGMFKKSTVCSWQKKISVLAVLFHYFAFGMVQPSVYNALLCPLFALLMAYYGSKLPKSEVTVEE